MVLNLDQEKKYLINPKFLGGVSWAAANDLPGVIALPDKKNINDNTLFLNFLQNTTFFILNAEDEWEDHVKSMIDW